MICGRHFPKESWQNIWYFHLGFKNVSTIFNSAVFVFIGVNYHMVYLYKHWTCYSVWRKKLKADVCKRNCWDVLLMFAIIKVNTSAISSNLKDIVEQYCTKLLKNVFLSKQELPVTQRSACWDSWLDTSWQNLWQVLVHKCRLLYIDCRRHLHNAPYIIVTSTSNELQVLTMGTRTK